MTTDKTQQAIMQFSKVQVAFIYTFLLEWNETFFVREDNLNHELIETITPWLSQSPICLFDHKACERLGPLVPVLVKDNNKLNGAIGPFTEVRQCTTLDGRDKFRPMFRYFMAGTDHRITYDHIVLTAANAEGELTKPAHNGEQETKHPVTIERCLSLGADGAGSYVATFVFKGGTYDEKLLYDLVNMPTRIRIEGIEEPPMLIGASGQVAVTVSRLFHNDLTAFLDALNKKIGETRLEEEKPLSEVFTANGNATPFIMLRDHDVVPEESRFSSENGGEASEYGFYQLPSVYLVLQPQGEGGDECSDIFEWIDSAERKRWHVLANVLMNLRFETQDRIDDRTLRRSMCHDKEFLPNLLINKDIYTMMRIRTFITLCDDYDRPTCKGTIEEITRAIELVRQRWHFSMVNNLLLDRVITEIRNGKGSLYIPRVDSALYRKLIERRRRCVAFLATPCGKGSFSRMEPAWDFTAQLWEELQISELNEALIQKLHLTETLYTDMFQFQNLRRLEGRREK